MTDPRPCTRCAEPTEQLNGLCGACSRRAADRADNRRLFNNRPTRNRRTRRRQKGPAPMTPHLDLTLCSVCAVALGYWLPPERMCPTCAALAHPGQEATP